MHQTAKMVVDGKSTPNRQTLAWCKLPCSMHHEAATRLRPSLHVTFLPSMDMDPHCTFFRPSPQFPTELPRTAHVRTAGVTRERCHGHPSTFPNPPSSQ